MPKPAIRPAAFSEAAIRLARREDAQDLFGLLALCFAEYPGCYVDPHEDLIDLRDPGASFAEKGGAFWLIEDERGRACACVAVDRPEPGLAELHRLYVRPDARRRGLGEGLVRLAEDHARAGGARAIFFWSDTRFFAAHRLYERLGYRRAPGTRELGTCPARWNTASRRNSEGGHSGAREARTRNPWSGAARRLATSLNVGSGFRFAAPE
jgi:putative acetyltransferase